MWWLGDTEAGLEVPLTAEGLREVTSLWASLTLCKGVRKPQPRKESKGCVREKQSRARNWVNYKWPLTLLWSGEPLSQERLAGPQSSKGCQPLCLPPTNTN